MGIQRLSRALVKRGFDVTVIHDTDAYMTLAGKRPTGGRSNHEMMADGVRVLRVGGAVPQAANLLTHQFGLPVVHGEHIKHLLEDGDFDIIWYHNISMIGGPKLLTYGRGLKIYEAHEHWLVCPTHVLWRYNKELCDKRRCLSCTMSYGRPPQLWRYGPLLKKCMDSVDVVIAKSMFSAAKHKEFGFEREMYVVPYFLPDASEAPGDAAPPQERPYFLFVGRLEKIKGLDDVIPAFRARPDVDLIVLGDGEHAPALKEMARGLENVKFLGRLAPEALSVYYKHAVALIVPSVCFETFGIILIESFQKGTPVLARRIGPFPEIVEAIGGGELFSTQEEMIHAMAQLTGDSGYRERLAQACRSSFATHWSEDVVMRQYLDVLRGAALAKGQTELAEALTD